MAEAESICAIEALFDDNLAGCCADYRNGKICDWCGFRQACCITALRVLPAPLAIAKASLELEDVQAEISTEGATAHHSGVDLAVPR